MHNSTYFYKVLHNFTHTLQQTFTQLFKTLQHFIKFYKKNFVAAAEVVQVEVGPPVPGTYRHDFMNDTEPRQVPMSIRGNTGHIVAMFGPTQTEDVAALEVVTQLTPGELHDMSRLPAPVWHGFARAVAVGLAAPAAAAAGPAPASTARKRQTLPLASPTHGHDPCIPS